MSLFVINEQAAAQPIPGCVNGLLTDHKAYVFALLGAVEGQSATTSWPQTFAQSGLPGPLPNVAPNFAVHYGITQSISAAGPRSRIWLPTAIPEIDELGNRWYTHTVDLVDPQTLAWIWLDRGGHPVVPAPCVGGPAPVPTPIPQPPSESLILSELRSLRSALDAGFATSGREHIEIRAAVDRPGWVMRILENKYVQMALFSIYTAVETKVGLIGKLFD